MNQIKTIEGNFENGIYAGKFPRFGIAVARFNSFIVDRLLEGALEALEEHGVQSSNIIVVKVPGAYELPLAVRKMASTKRFDAIIALGAVIRGDTPHFDYVAGACANGLSQVSLTSGIPVTFGVLTVDTVEQAMARAAIRPDKADSSQGADKNEVKRDKQSKNKSGKQGEDSPGKQAYVEGDNKGAEAALTAMAMVSLSRQIDGL